MRKNDCFLFRGKYPTFAAFGNISKGKIQQNFRRNEFFAHKNQKQHFSGINLLKHRKNMRKVADFFLFQEQISHSQLHFTNISR